MAAGRARGIRIRSSWSRAGPGWDAVVWSNSSRPKWRGDDHRGCGRGRRRRGRGGSFPWKLQVAAELAVDEGPVAAGGVAAASAAGVPGSDAAVEVSADEGDGSVEAGLDDVALDDGAEVALASGVSEAGAAADVPVDDGAAGSALPDEAPEAGSAGGVEEVSVGEGAGAAGTEETITDRRDVLVGAGVPRRRGRPGIAVAVGGEKRGEIEAGADGGRAALKDEGRWSCWRCPVHG